MCFLICSPVSHHAIKVDKRPRERFRPWVPDKETISLLRDTDAVSCQGQSSFPLIELVMLNARIGRRGLLNLGQTCYLNVVLQAFIHNPLLRNYFLSDSHNHKLCKIRDCVCCEMDKLFAEVIGTLDFYSESLTHDRFTLPTWHLTVPFLSWHPLGELLQSWRVTPSKTRMNSSYPH